MRESSGFLRTASVPANAMIRIQFAVPALTTKESILGTVYRAEWCGDTVMSISPRGTRISLYQRDKDAVSMVEKLAPNVAFAF